MAESTHLLTDPDIGYLRGHVAVIAQLCLDAVLMSTNDHDNNVRTALESVLREAGARADACMKTLGLIPKLNSAAAWLDIEEGTPQPPSTTLPIAGVAAMPSTVAPASRPRIDDFAAERSRVAQQQARSTTFPEELRLEAWGGRHFEFLATNLEQAEAIVALAIKSVLEGPEPLDHTQLGNAVAHAADLVNDVARLTAKVAPDMPFFERLARATSLLEMSAPLIANDFDLLSNEGLIANYFKGAHALIEQAIEMADEEAAVLPAQSVQPAAAAADPVAALPPGARAAMEMVRAVSAADEASYVARGTSDMNACADIVERALVEHVVDARHQEHRKMFARAMAHYLVHSGIDAERWAPKLTDPEPAEDMVPAASAE